MKRTITFQNGRYLEIREPSGEPPPDGTDRNGDLPTGEVPFDFGGGGELTFETPTRKRGDDNHADQSSELYVY